jgi:hypothetical protein
MPSKLIELRSTGFLSGTSLSTTRFAIYLLNKLDVHELDRYTINIVRRCMLHSFCFSFSLDVFATMIDDINFHIK